MYLDSGIIVKLLVREPDSDWFDKRLSGQVLDSSELSLTEVCSALSAKERSGAISRDRRQQAMLRFEEMVEDEILQLLPLDREVLDRACAILRACPPSLPLRTLDALHVASCDLYRCEALSTTDRRMRAAGAQLAIRLFPSNLEEIPL